MDVNDLQDVQKLLMYKTRQMERMPRTYRRVARLYAAVRESTGNEVSENYRKNIFVLETSFVIRQFNLCNR